MNNYKLKHSDNFMCYENEILSHGNNAKINISIYPKLSNCVIEKNITNKIKELSKEKNLENLLEKFKKEEEQIYYDIYKSMERWISKAEKTKLCILALEYQKQNKKNREEKTHSNNKWVTNLYNTNKKEISNNIYAMSYDIYDTDNYNYKKGIEEKIFYVSWYIYIKGIKRNIKIAGQHRKRYTDYDKAIKYIEGRKKAYKHLFAEINPAVPKEYEHLYKINGLLVEGINIKQ